MTARSLQRAGVAVACLAVVAGCGDPYAKDPSPARTATPVGGVAGNVDERPVGDASAPEPGPGGVPGPNRPMLAAGPRSLREVASWYARTAVNWDWQTLADQLTALRSRSARALSSDLTTAIRATHSDESLARDHPASAGAVVAVSARRTGRLWHLVVVTRERETARDVEPLGPAMHRVYLGEARRLAGDWRIVAWRRAP